MGWVPFPTSACPVAFPRIASPPAPFPWAPSFQPVPPSLRPSLFLPLFSPPPPPSNPPLFACCLLPAPAPPPAHPPRAAGDYPGKDAAHAGAAQEGLRRVGAHPRQQRVRTQPAPLVGAGAASPSRRAGTVQASCTCGCSVHARLPRLLPPDAGLWRWPAGMWLCCFAVGLHRRRTSRCVPHQLLPACSSARRCLCVGHLLYLLSRMLSLVGPCAGCGNARRWQPACVPTTPIPP